MLDDQLADLENNSNRNFSFQNYYFYQCKNYHKGYLTTREFHQLKKR